MVEETITAWSQTKSTKSFYNEGAIKAYMHCNDYKFSLEPFTNVKIAIIFMATNEHNHINLAFKGQ